MILIQIQILCQLSTLTYVNNMFEETNFLLSAVLFYILRFSFVNVELNNSDSFTVLRSTIEGS